MLGPWMLGGGRRGKGIDTVLVRPEGSPHHGPSPLEPRLCKGRSPCDEAVRESVPRSSQAQAASP